MIHGMRIKDGKATYVSRFVKTSRIKQEEYFGGSKFMKVYLASYLLDKKRLKKVRLLVLINDLFCIHCCAIYRGICFIN